MSATTIIESSRLSQTTRSIPHELDYRPDVDGLRAISILAVLGFHAGIAGLPGGFCGVDVFFVISGFLITGIILQELASHTFSFRKFYARRARRLFPALVIVILTTLVLGWLVLLPDEFQQLGADIAAGSAFSANLAFYFDTNAYFFSGNQPLIHLWSLGVEEQFYFLWPALIYGAWRLGKKWPSRVCALAIVASFLANVYIVSLDTSAAFFLPWNRLWELALGAWLAMRARNLLFSVPHRFAGAGSSLLGAAGAALLIASFLFVKSSVEFPGFWALLPTAGAALVILSGPAGWLSGEVLSRPTIVYLGKVSYPLYLWHWPLLCLARLVDPAPDRPYLITTAVLLLAAFLSILTYELVELPIRRTPRKITILVGACVLLACCAITGQLIFLQRIPARAISKQVERFVLPVEEDWRSADSVTWTAFTDEFVEIGDSPNKSLFIGDSFMQQYFPRIERVVEESNGRVNSAVFAARAACSLPFEFSWAFGREACRRHVEKALRYAKRQDVDTVIIASNWPRYFTIEQNGDRVLNRASLPALFRLGQTIASLRQQNKRVYIVLIAPIDERLDPRARIARTFLSPGYRVIDVPPPPRRDIQRKYAEIESLVERTARDNGAIVIDPMKDLCDDGICPSLTSDAKPMYYNSSHLRPSFVRNNARFMDQTVLPIR